MSEESRPRGGMFLFENVSFRHIVTPELLTEDQRNIRDACRQVVQRRIAANPEALEAHEGEPHVPLMKELGELGLLGVDVPEAWGGLGMGMVAGTAVIDELGRGGSASFTTTFSAHVGISTWPVQYFGTDAQRAKYLPRLASGEIIGAYALTEPQSGSDALAAKTAATRLEDGSWELNGGKIFITNAAFADLFTVFAKVDGKNACFLVERGLPGFAIDGEEHKLGIKGSSTRTISFSGVRLPADALLGEVGQGHKVVLNTLNLGRFKLAAGVVGGMRQSLATATAYAKERKQFGRPIAEFGAVRQMLAQTAVDTFVAESMVYRTAGLLDDALEGAGSGDAAAKAIHGCSIECSIVKFAVSDMLYACRDREVQVFGGNGFIEEYSPARGLRDARIFRIFEGTNEINALHAISELLKRSVKGELPLFAQGSSDGVSAVKQAFLRIAKAAALKYQQGIAQQQELLLDLAHVMANIYAGESANRRLCNMGGRGAAAVQFADQVMIVHGHAAIMDCVRRLSRVAVAVGQPEHEPLALLARLALDQNVIAAEIAVGNAVIAAGGYPL